jgi:GLPGLI family protein
MKKRIYLLQVVVFFISYFVQAQQVETSKVTIKYEFIYVVDSTMPDKPNTYQGILHIGNTMSFFGDEGSLRTDRFVKQENEKNNVRLTRHTLFYGAPVYFFRNTALNKISSIAQLKGNTYLIDEKIVTPDWKISPETKEIKGYLCQKATTEFRGRSYEAWFCPKMPYPYGPWKLGGLPGLILEASDSKKEVVFNFKSIQDTAFTIELPANTIATTTRELNKAIEAYQTSMSSGSSGGGMMSQIGASNATPTKRKTFNNPIEKENK